MSTCFDVSFWYFNVKKGGRTRSNGRAPEGPDTPARIAAQVHDNMRVIQQRLSHT